MPWLLLTAALAESPYIVVLGTAQDGGHPQAGCQRACCEAAWNDPSVGHHVSSLGLVDPDSGQRWIIDATPDLPAQMRALDQTIGQSGPLEGVLLTHAHIGHYLGLTNLGREVMGSKGVSVFAMPRMREYLSTNGPWSQLVDLGNITLEPLAADQPLALSPSLTVTPILVPHRDEFSETVGFRIDGPDRSAIFIPDIDKWEKWDHKLAAVVRSVDRAWVDGTFYDIAELPGRDMSEIPHPMITETVFKLRTMPKRQRAKVAFIHLNHSNPALDPTSEATQMVERAGMSIAVEGDRFTL